MIMENNTASNNGDDNNEQHGTKTKIRHNNNNNNNDTLLASKIDVLLLQHHHHYGSSNSKTKKKKKRQSSNSICEVYANECQVIALIMLSRIQDFHIYMQTWQRHYKQLTHFLSRLLRIVSSSSQHQQQTADNDDDDDDCYALSLLQPHWIRLVAHLLSRFDHTATIATAVNKDDTTINVVLPPHQLSSIIVVVVDALTDILLTSLLIQKNETTTAVSLLQPQRNHHQFQHHHRLLQKAHVEAIMSISCALDIAFASSPSSLLSSLSSSSFTLNYAKIDRILSCIWIYYHDIIIACNSTTTITTTTMEQQQTLPFGVMSSPITDHCDDDDDPKLEIKMIPNNNNNNNNKKESFDIMLQTLTAMMWTNHDDDDDKDDDSSPVGETTPSTVEQDDDTAANRLLLLDACWHILSLYGARMSSTRSNSNSSSPTSASSSNTVTAMLPSFWKLALKWWCSNHQKSPRHTTNDDNNNNEFVVAERGGDGQYHGHCLVSWAELLLQIIQQPGTHDCLQQLLLQPLVADDSRKHEGGGGGGGDGDHNNNNVNKIDFSSSSSSSCYSSNTAQNLFHLLLTCIVSPEQQRQAALSLTAATTAPYEVDGDDTSGRGDRQKDTAKQQQVNNRVLRPLAWTCLTNLLQSEQIGWDWLLLMETTASTSSSSSSISSNQGRHLTTLVRLAVGEWKIQLGYYLAVGDDSEKNGTASCKQQEKQEQDCQTLIQVCGQFIVQTVQFVALLADDHDNDESKRRATALPLLSATSINHLRRSLDEALDAAVQYLGLHPEQHGRVPQIDACVIRVLGSLLTEMNVFEQQQQGRQPKRQSHQNLSPHQQDHDDNAENDNATIHALRIAMELTTRSSSKNNGGGGGSSKKVSLQENEGYHALMPSLAYVLASAEGDEHCVQLLKDYNVLDRDILPLFLHSFWNHQQRYENIQTFASVVPWCCQVIELYVGLVTVVETDLLQADLIAWIRHVLPQLPLSLSSSTSEQQQVLVTSLESVVSCYVTLQGETQPPEPDFSILQQALETCARYLSSEKG